MALKIKRAPEKIDDVDEVDNELDTTTAESAAHSVEVDETANDEAAESEVEADEAETDEDDADDDAESDDTDDDDDESTTTAGDQANDQADSGIPEDTSDILAEIAEAEQRCSATEARVNIMRENLKQIKKEYDGNVIRLRKLCSALVKDEDRPLFKQAQKPSEAKPAEPVTVTTVEVAAELPAIDPDAWRRVPLTEVAFGEIKGFGPKKQEALHLTCPTVGDFEDLRAGKGIASIKGISEEVAAELTDRVLDHLSKTRDAATLAAAARTSSAEESGITQEAAEQPIEKAEPEYMSAREWDKLSDEKQAQHLLLLAEHLADYEGDNLLDHLTSKHENKSFWSAGQEAHGKGLALTDCGILPGPEQDDWVRGYLYAENLADEPAAETASATATTTTAAKSTEPVDLDDL